MKLPKKEKITPFIRKWREERRKLIMKYVEEHTEYILGLLYRNRKKKFSFEFNTIDIPRIGIKYIAMKYNLNSKISKIEPTEYKYKDYKYELVISRK